jgi:hypothetical protein
VIAHPLNRKGWGSLANHVWSSEELVGLLEAKTAAVAA